MGKEWFRGGTIRTEDDRNQDSPGDPETCSSRKTVARVAGRSRTRNSGDEHRHADEENRGDRFVSCGDKDQYAARRNKNAMACWRADEDRRSDGVSARTPDHS